MGADRCHDLILVDLVIFGQFTKIALSALQKYLPNLTVQCATLQDITHEEAVEAMLEDMAAVVIVVVEAEEEVVAVAKTATTANTSQVMTTVKKNESAMPYSISKSTTTSRFV